MDDAPTLRCFSLPIEGFQHDRTIHPGDYVPGQEKVRGTLRLLRRFAYRNDEGEMGLLHSARVDEMRR
jgi:hypothetical protein